jgi:uncharacterized membrane protein
MTFPPLPAWNALHVLIVHFPLGLLLVAVPVLLILALLFPKTGRQFVWAAAVVLVVGTASSFLAVQTGAAAGDLAESQGAKDDKVIYQALELHEKLADQTRLAYTILTIAFLLYLFTPVALRRPLNPGLNFTLLAIFLAASGAAGLLLVNTGHAGGLLVHEHGITAKLVSSDAAPAAASEGGNDEQMQGADDKQKSQDED